MEEFVAYVRQMQNARGHPVAIEYQKNGAVSVRNPMIASFLA